MLRKLLYTILLPIMCASYADLGPYDVVQLFAVTPEEIAEKTAHVIKLAHHSIATIIERQPLERTFDNTIQACDTIIANSPLAITKNILHALELVHPDEHIRTAARENTLIISKFIIDQLMFNKKLYDVFQDYAMTQESLKELSEEEQQFLKNILQDFKKIGLDLPEDERMKISILTQEIEELSITFQKNVSEDTTFLCLERHELAGTPEKFIDSLELTKDGYYKVSPLTSTFLTIMGTCTMPTTRQQLWHAFNRRAYPINEKVLETIIAKRRELAHILGYADFATLSISNMMAKTPLNVHQFLAPLLDKAQQQEAQELELLAQHLPESVELVDGKFMPWDIHFTKESYKNTHLNFNREVIQEYFPMDSTIQGLFNIYQSFFNITFIEHPVSDAWHPEVRLIEVQDGSTKITLGYILLDLHPRPYKFTHAAATSIIPAQIPSEQSTPQPAVALVVANFSRNNDNQPALWDLDVAVRTFFHEFGHALHMILGRTRFATESGVEVKRDFVEMPSQMLELWLNDREILRSISSHHLTKEHLPEHIIDNLEASRLFGKAGWMTGQITYALVSLGIYQGEDNNPPQIIEPIIDRIMEHASSYLMHPKDSKFYCSFIHLTGYGAGYYGYLWSQVYAVDLFEAIQQHGLMDPEIGQRYRNEILRHGGSKDPEELLHNFLGRAPSIEPFLRYYGMNVP